MSSYKAKIDVVAVPFSGHLYPLIELMQPLLASGKYEIRFFTGVQKVALLEQLGFTVIPLFPDQPTIMEDIANTDSQVKSNGLAMYHQLKQNLTLLPRLVTFFKGAFADHGTDLVVADFIAVPVGLACDPLALPWITTIPTPFALETSQGTPSYLGGWQEHPQFLYQWRDYVGRKVVRGFKRTMALAVRKQLAPLNVQLYDQHGRETIYSPYSIVGLGMKEVEFKRNYPPHFQLVGACCQSPEEGAALSWPEGYEKRVFVSIGTHLEWGKAHLLKVVAALADNYPTYFVAVSLGNSQLREQPPQELGENVRVYQYLPYSDVIPQFDYVIHHGGAGIFYNCLKYAKPALIIPHDYDQFDYAARAVKGDLAIRVNRLTERTLLTSFQQLIQRQWPQLTEISLAFEEYQASQALENEIQRLLKGRVT